MAFATRRRRSSSLSILAFRGSPPSSSRISRIEGFIHFWARVSTVTISANIGSACCVFVSAAYLALCSLFHVCIISLPTDVQPYAKINLGRRPASLSNFSVGYLAFSHVFRGQVQILASVNCVSRISSYVRHNDKHTFIRIVGRIGIRAALIFLIIVHGHAPCRENGIFPVILYVVLFSSHFFGRPREHWRGDNGRHFCIFAADIFPCFISAFRGF